MRLKLYFAALAILASLGCASGSPRHITTVSVVTGHSILSFAQDTEMGLVCGKPTAPPAPTCVDAERHKEISGIFVQAFDLDIRAAKLAKALPDGAAQSADLTAILAQVEDLLKVILGKIPGSPKKDALVRDLGR